MSHQLLRISQQQNLVLKYRYIFKQIKYKAAKDLSLK